MMLCLKFFFQVPFFCECGDFYGLYKINCGPSCTSPIPAVRPPPHPFLPPTRCLFSCFQRSTSIPKLIGIYPFDLSQAIFAKYVVYDILVLAMLNFNQYNMKRTVRLPTPLWSDVLI
jgi:hypothetical protein